MDDPTERTVISALAEAKPYLNRCQIEGCTAEHPDTGPPDIWQVMRVEVSVKGSDTADTRVDDEEFEYAVEQGEVFGYVDIFLCPQHRVPSPVDALVDGIVRPILFGPGHIRYELRDPEDEKQRIAKMRTFAAHLLKRCDDAETALEAVVTERYIEEVRRTTLRRIRRGSGPGSVNSKSDSRSRSAVCSPFNSTRS